MTKQPTGSTNTKREPDTEFSLKRDVLQPGQLVATDQYACKLRGRLLNSRGSTPEHEKYGGGTIFVDIATGKVSVHHQVSLGASETIQAKINFEREALSAGVLVTEYLSDNGIYTSAEFTRELHKTGQGLRRSGVGAHHQNGIAERAIRTVTERARTMMLHAATKWPEQAHMDLWPIAMSFLTYLWNHTPIQGVWMSPVELFSKTKLPNSPLVNAKVQGCPAYGLEPGLQSGIKIPKWNPRSRRGQFVGYSVGIASPDWTDVTV